ncbi:guanylate kinase [Luteolibacter pohnpeiensis]|uniref:Guanylate kinase n=1 Tax=Luteolibacter pohnpeiensis TaxID=454153 RepID=A0A934VVQ2_9BACT|nr:guanylate kinase [Luteolibacter pohnpeiensis]MBK1882440.1 guanylate kinase [Luteolibacter pohnpeiensis]
MSARTGILLVVSGPSGSGKTTLCRRLANDQLARYSISCTTRSPRPGEIDGEHYHFLSTAEFEAKLQAGEFLEHATVHGNFYGTLKSEVTRFLTDGVDVVMDIDIQGAAQIRDCDDEEIKRAVVDLFVMPPSREELLARLSGRGTDSQETIDLRMENALEEVASWPKYTYRLLSATPDEDYARFTALLSAERMKVNRMVD